MVTPDPPDFLLAEISRSAGLLWWLQREMAQADSLPVLAALYDCERRHLQGLSAVTAEARSVALAEQTGRQVTQTLCDFADRLREP